MALWGNQDNLTGPTPVTVIGTASSEFWTASASGLSGIATGTTVLLDGGDSGFVTLEGELSTDLFRVGKMSGVGTDVNAAFPATYSEQPISLKNDPGYAESSADGSLGRTQKPVGVSTAEIIAGAATTNFGGIHAGWVGVTTYVDGDGNYRVKSETFVASSSVQPGNRPFPS
jgi:hypothetical protein